MWAGWFSFFFSVLSFSLARFGVFFPPRARDFWGQSEIAGIWVFFFPQETAAVSVGFTEEEKRDLGDQLFRKARIVCR